MAGESFGLRKLTECLKNALTRSWPASKSALEPRALAETANDSEKKGGEKEIDGDLPPTCRPRQRNQALAQGFVSAGLSKWRNLP
jgi:hypothetical protein